jgi:hypothetical protein
MDSRVLEKNAKVRVLQSFHKLFSVIFEHGKTAELICCGPEQRITNDIVAGHIVATVTTGKLERIFEASSLVAHTSLIKKLLNVCCCMIASNYTERQILCSGGLYVKHDG